MSLARVVRSRSWWRASGAWALAVAIVALAYAPSLRGGFLWDDDGHVTKPELRSWSGLARIWLDVGATQQHYPLLHSAFWIEHRLWGDATSGYRLVNVVLHASSACLLALLLTRLGVPGAWLAAGVFALHPVEVESVAWITEQKNTLSTVFYLLAALAYLRFDERRRPRAYGCATLLFVCALLSKSVTVTLPAALLVVLWWRRGRLSWRRDAMPLAPWLALGVAMGLFTAWVERAHIGAQGEEWSLSFVERLLLAGRATWFYLGKLAWPAELIFIYPRWNIDAGALWQYLFPLAALGGVAVLWAMRRRSRAPLAVALLYIGSLFPALGFFNVYPFRYSFVADHFQYLASLSAFAAAAGLTRLSARWPRWVGVSLAACLLAALGAKTWRQSAMYRDVETLYRTTLSQNPDSGLMLNNLSFFLVSEGRDREAIAILENSLRREPDSFEIHFHLAIALERTDRAPEAVEHYRQALRLKPDDGNVERCLGSLLRRMGRTQEAIERLNRAITLLPPFAEPLNELALALADAGRTDEAIAYHLAALRVRPGFADARRNLASLLLQARRPRDAIPHYEALLLSGPGNADALNDLAVALYQSGRVQEAIARFEEALRLSPDNAEIHFNLGVALRSVGRRDEAIAQFKKSLEIRPGHTPAQAALDELAGPKTPCDVPAVPPK